MKRRLVWSATARRDLAAIIRHIQRDNPTAASRAADRIDQAANALANHATGRPGRISGTYEKSIPKLTLILAYEIFSLADGSEAVGILHVIHTARNWPKDEWPAG